LNRYIMFRRGICEKNQSRDEKFPEPKGEWNLVSRLVFFANTLPKHDISVSLHRILFKTLAKWIIPFVCRFQEYSFFIVCNLAIVKYYRTLGTVPFSRYSGNTCISICFVRQWLKYSEWIWWCAAREGKKVKYVFANTTAEGKKVKSFTTEHFRVSNLINHVTLRIKVKKKYSEWIWRFDAREDKTVKYAFANTTAQREKS
jgi:hypothetical protein